MAVEDAEHFTTAAAPRLSSFDLRIGSDVEIAHKIVERLEELYGPVIVCESRVWRFDQTHWAALDDDHLVRFVHRADGALYVNADGKPQVVRLNKSRVASILDAAIKYRHQPDYFKSPPRGINCESGFIRIGDGGGADLMPHARQWRQRHVVRGRWPVAKDENAFEKSLLAKYLRDAVMPEYNAVGNDEDARKAADADAAEKVMLLGEIAGCTALGWGTRIRNPKAIVAYSSRGNTGKSTFLKILRALPNPESVSSVPPSKFGDEKYTYRLIGKVLNAADELPDRAVRSDVFKRLITGEPVPARDVYRSATDFVPVALHSFSTNVLPSFSGGVDGGILRRLLPIEFMHQLKDEECDPDLVSKILEADFLLHFAVQGARRLISRGDFTIPASSRELLQQWVHDADPVRSWAAERLKVTTEESNISVRVLFADFLAWADCQALKREFLPNARAFGKRLRSVDPNLQFHRSNGSICRNARLRT
jgi:P4 family phage/plasmid primase-like protien